MAVKLQEPFAFVIFGGTGDLSRRKLIPALDHLSGAGLMPEKVAVIGVARGGMNDDSYRNSSGRPLKSIAREKNPSVPASPVFWSPSTIIPEILPRPEPLQI